MRMKPTLWVLMLIISASSCPKDPGGMTETFPEDRGALGSEDITAHDSLGYSYDVHPSALSLSPELMDVMFPAGNPDLTGFAAQLPKDLHSPPRGGTVSHHLLAAAHIDAWFRDLASYGTVDTFIIISPAHWVHDGANLKYTTLDWDGYLSRVECDVEAAVYLAGRAGLVKEPAAFHREHGVDVLIPYIAAYFPGSRVVPVLQVEERLDSDGLRNFGEAAAALQRKDSGKRYFFMVSADFSHHADRETTAIRDARTAESLPFLSPSLIPSVYTDNRGGMLALTSFFGQPPSDYRLLGRTTSWDLSGEDPEDITSYFFTFFR